MGGGRISVWEQQIFGVSVSHKSELQIEGKLKQIWISANEEQTSFRIETKKKERSQNKCRDQIKRYGKIG